MLVAPVGAVINSVDETALPYQNNATALVGGSTNRQSLFRSALLTLFAPPASMPKEELAQAAAALYVQGEPMSGAGGSLVTVSGSLASSKSSV